MERSPEQFQELLARARLSFLEELQPKHNRITTLISERPDLPTEVTHEILRFFHSIHGSASTLGFEPLAALSKEGEKWVNEILRRGDVLPLLRVEITNILKSLQNELNQVKSLTHLEAPNRVSKGYSNLPEASKILLIDDDTTILNLLESAFSIEGYMVYICDDSFSAMDLIALSKPDIIILDIMMPKIDGYELLAKIKERPEYSDICIIFLSAKDDIEAKIKGMEAGIDDYITKPFNLREVVSRVEMILRRANKYKEKFLKDSLTGAYSRSYLNDRFKNELECYKRNKSIFSVAFIDLDFFKRINDEYGHSAGDFVLKTFVEFMITNLRGSDCLFRYGGEEFVVLLPDTNEIQAYGALERLRDIFSKKLLSFAEKELSITFSCGIKEVDENDKSVSLLLSMVDEAMYAAKRAGRNRVIRYSVLDNSMGKKTILIVDDESAILRLLSERLSEAGYNTILASNGQQALECIAERSIDAIILDLILPDMDGLEICGKIKESTLTNRTRVVILSKKSGKEDIVKGLQCGADDYVTKPFSMAELEARILRVLKH
jgi:two-component system, cell cycle response regulator